MKQVKLIEHKGNIAIVKYKDKDGVTQCGIIDGSLVSGKEFSVPNNVLDTATPYGIDWSIVYPSGLVIDANVIQEALYGLGIYTLNDVRKNANGVIAAINSVLRLTNAKLLKKARTTLESGGK